MFTHLSRRSFLSGTTALAALSTLAACHTPPVGSGAMPRQLVWSTYSVGTGTYNDLAAIANTLTQQKDIAVRLMTSETGIGRLAPLITETAHYARAGDEYYYAFEGDDEFASPQWGPQRLRQVWAPPGNYGVLVREDSGIETVADLEGARYPKLIASTSMNRKLEAILNYGGLTSDDVTLVEVSYGEQLEALRTGQIDALYHNVVGANVEELASEYPVRWLDLGGEDDSRYETWSELAPMVRPGEFTDGAGLAEGESAVNMQYSIPLTTLAERNDDEVHMLASAIHENFEHFKDVTPDASQFAADKVLLDPMVVPFHDGAIQFFREMGRWTPDMEARNAALVEREDAMIEKWPQFLADYEGSDQLALRWREWKQENLPELPDIADATSASESGSDADTSSEEGEPS